MAKVKIPKSAAQMKAEMAVSRARGVNPAPPVDQVSEFRPTQAGDTVGGYMVREDIPDTSSIGASLENYRTLGLREVPMTAFSVRGKPEYYSKSTREYTQNLAEQINQNKELNPLIVVKDKEGYYVLEGGHRFDALRELNAQSFPALVVEDLDGMAKGGTVRMAKGGRLPKVAPKVEVPQAAPARPLSSRIDMSFKDVTKRTPELQEAAKKIASGELSAAEYDALVNEYKPVTPYNFVPTPATREEAIGALTANKKQKYGAAEEWEAGTPVGLRLDIPAYSDHGVWVNSIHGPESTAYGNVSSVLDATFGRFDDKALRVAQGESKSPFAKIEGKWNPVSEQEAIARANEYLASPEWRQVGMDPERHGYFYDRETMQPVVASEEVLQIGPLVLAKNPKYGDKGDYKFAHGGVVNMRDGGDPDQEFYDRMREEFSVYNKPTYGSEIPGTPTIDQQRLELTLKGQQDAENRARTTKDSLTAMDPAGTLGIADVLKTFGKSIVAPIAYVGGNAFDWLQTGKVDPAKSKARGEALEEWMRPKTQEGGEFLEDISKVGPAITGSEMGFGMHPNLWVSGIGLTTPKQTAAGLRLGKERITPFAKDVGTMATELYESGRMPGMVAPNLYAVSPEGKPTKALAPANEMGFYSPVEATALNLQRKSGSGQAFLNDIMKGENVRPDEIKTMGLDTFLKDKKNVTADEVRDYISQNKIPLSETVYSGSTYNRDKDGLMLQDLKQRTEGMTPQQIVDKFGERTYNSIIRLENLRDRSTPEILSNQASNFAVRADMARDNNDLVKAEEFDALRDHYKARAAQAEENYGKKPVKFEGWQLPGGENYREVVITLPAEGTAKVKELDQNYRNHIDLADDAMKYYKQLSNEYPPGDPKIRAAYQKYTDARKLRDEAKDQLREEIKKSDETTYRSSHWEEPNPLAHIRMSDRVTDGKKTLLIDEVQSDWHQAGREEGYKRPESNVAKQEYENYKADLIQRFEKDLRARLTAAGDSPEKIDEIVNKQLSTVAPGNMARALNEPTIFNKYYEAVSEERRSNASRFDGVPDAPYKEDWYQLALRRAIKEGIDKGYDRIALPTGDRVAERFDMSKQVSLLTWNPKTKTLIGKTVDGGDLIQESNITEKNLSDYVGKEAAKNLIASSQEDGWHVIQGDDLKVGGKGMKKYYDEVYPNYLKKFGKKYGANVGTTYIDIDDVPEPLHYMDITPKMREEFKTGIHMKRGGKVSFANSIDSMRYELSKG